MGWYLNGICYDPYCRPMTVPCNIIVSDVTDGSLITTSTSSGNGEFSILIDSVLQDTYIVTFYKAGDYGIDSNIAGAIFLTTISGA